MNNEEDLNVGNPAALAALLTGDVHNFFVAATKGGIEAQEKKGQSDFVNSTTLPKKAPWDKLEKIGIVRKEDEDDLFANCVLPKGWKKVSTDHSMWSNLVDDKGRKRASIFYKAAFYDRDAFLSIIRRFYVVIQPEDFYERDMSYEERQSGKWAAVVTDCDEIIFQTDWVHLPGHKDYEKRTQVENNLKQKALDWINGKYPDWEDETAYWD